MLFHLKQTLIYNILCNRQRNTMDLTYGKNVTLFISWPTLGDCCAQTEIGYRTRLIYYYVTANQSWIAQTENGNRINPMW